MRKSEYILIIAVLCLLLISCGNSGGRESAVSQANAENTKESRKAQDHHRKPLEESVYRFEKQEITVNDFEAEGYILDIGGGGEGVIGVLKGSQVIAIDISKRELEEAPDGPLKIIMDARDLKYLDDTFNTATSFFTLMYINGADHEKVFNEIFRVLKPGGRFLIWDTIFMERPDEKTEYGLVNLYIKLPDKEISTGYGVRWPEKIHDIAYYERLGRRSGFSAIDKKEEGHTFFLELKKP